ncbi:hypothetical protein F5I97DRAFT_862930 [Phlebopus sp. FC_14]|nr:hypothetical protein F5I97DRAFT_862930 [Phlebopus sp. FC_14]
MKFVALLSGGKDSCFNLVHCKENGHTLVAAATLSPHSGKDEIDSYMYQTVGQDGIDLIAQALDVPLYRRVIQGAPVEQGPEYGQKTPGGGGITGDETEDMYVLLNNVLEHHPDVQGVSVGAILSNYQRVRVEHVCRRLSLTPLAYLWQRNQTSLLSEMTTSALHAILIKVSGAGLTPSHLGRSLVSMEPTLRRLHKLYGTHPCGEGGEYETFTLDCPVFRKKVELLEKETVVVDDNDVAPVAYLRIKKARLVNKDVSTENLNVIVPPLLEAPFDYARRELVQLVGAHNDVPSLTVSEFVPSSHPPADLGPSVRVIGPWIAVGNVHLASDTVTRPIGEAVTRCFEILQALTLLLPDLDTSTFAAANSAYTAYFGASPPARACVGIGVNRVTLDCVAWVPGHFDKVAEVTKIQGEQGERKALHVQSLSYWAPANIGPYSQAISIPPRTFISGQIGLVPASLTLSTLPLETGLVLQHTARIIRAAPNARTGDGGDGGFGLSDHGSADEMEEGHGSDVERGGHVQLALYYLAHIQDVHHVRRVVSVIDEPRSPTLFTVLHSLPRGARVEKQVVVHSGRFVIPCPDAVGEASEEDSAEMITIEKNPEFVMGEITTGVDIGDAEIHWEVSHFPPSSERHLQLRSSRKTSTCLQSWVRIR